MDACYLPPLVILQCALCNFLGITAYLRRSGGKFFPLQRERLVGIVGVIMIIFALHLNIANVLNCFFSLQESIAPPPPWALLCVCVPTHYTTSSHLWRRANFTSKRVHTHIKGSVLRLAPSSQIIHQITLPILRFGEQNAAAGQRGWKKCPFVSRPKPHYCSTNFCVRPAFLWQSGVTPLCLLIFLLLSL